MKHFIAAFVATTCGLASLPAQAEQIFSENILINGGLCVGDSDCLAGETFPGGNFKIKDFDASMVFEDTSTPGIGFPTRDWRLRINDNVGFSSGGIERFSIEDLDAGTIPFTIEGGTGAHALYVAANGRLGFGTSLPQRKFHLLDHSGVDLRIEQTVASGSDAQTYDIRVDNTGFAILEQTTSTKIPFLINENATNNLMKLTNVGIRTNVDQDENADFGVSSQDVTDMLYVDSSANAVGIGTNTPEELLHIRSDAENTDAFALFDANGAGSDAAFLLRQNGLVPTTWEFRNQQSSGKLNVGTVGGTKPLKIDNLAATNLLRLGLNGQPNVVAVNGELRVNNTALNVPDYVFADDYTLRPLADVRAFIDANSHLPEVPSEADIKADGLNMTEMQMTLLKKVEELTLYTLEQDAKLAEMDSLKARLAQLEALLGD